MNFAKKAPLYERTLSQGITPVIEFRISILVDRKFPERINIFPRLGFFCLRVYFLHPIDFGTNFPKYLDLRTVSFAKREDV